MSVSWAESSGILVIAARIIRRLRAGQRVWLVFDDGAWRIL